MTGKIKIIIKSRKIELTAEIFDTLTGNKVWELLPISSKVKTWGEEIYFDIPLTLTLETDARAEVKVGEIGYWDVGKSMCVFWGRTPASKDENPVAASPVNVFGKVLDDPKVLDAVQEGDDVLVMKSS
ncbi:MAG: cyclophilin-like fold protein [Candidatus Helarchaeota archaeon]